MGKKELSDEEIKKLLLDGSHCARAVFERTRMRAQARKH